MPRLPKWSAPLLTATPLALAVCLTGPGAEPPAYAQAAPGKVAKEVRGEAGAKGGETQTKLITPDRAIDPSQLVDVVKEEVLGGEREKGPSPKNYLWQYSEGTPEDEPLTVKVPIGLPELVLNAQVPGHNPITKAKFELGKQLYFDPRVSKNGTVSCATCHDPERGWTDRQINSIGIDGQIGSRNAPTVLNTAYGKTMFWDGRAPSLEGQAQGPIQNKIEMGDQSYREIIARLRTIKGYQDQFRKVFGTEVTLDGMAKAVATFERAAALSGNSAYDRYTGDGSRGVEPDTKALTDGQKRGLLLFGLTLSDEDDFKPGDTVRAKANCTACHNGFNFSDEQFHNLGIGWNPKSKRFADLGRWAIAPVGAKNPAELGAFKTPTVRDAERTRPYMHDGSLKTLEEVVEHYDKGGTPNPALDKDMRPLKLTPQEKADLVAFMKALSGEPIKVALPELPVGPDGKRPDPRAALAVPAPKAALGAFHPAAVR